MAHDNIHNPMIQVEVAYAKPNEQKIITVNVCQNTTIEEVIQLSGILALYPEIDLQKNKVGIFSHIKTLMDTVKEGDRIEIYRSLLLDPKEARKLRVKKRGEK